MKTLATVTIGVLLAALIIVIVGMVAVKG